MSAIILLGDTAYPYRLSQIAGAPKMLFVKGRPLSELEDKTVVAVVGSRKITPYGQHVTEKLVEGLVRAGVVIVSGLALGTDSVAHRAALKAGGQTIAVLPASLERIYPASHANLARQIVEKGGTLVTEYDAEEIPYPSNFVARNRIVSGLSDAVLIPEAAKKSGSLHTANFALEQGREVLAVPGNITSPMSAGTNRLIRSGATPVTCLEDILEVLGLNQEIIRTSHAELTSVSDQEKVIIGLLERGVIDASELLNESQLDLPQFNQTLTFLEMNGHIKAVGSGLWTLI